MYSATVADLERATTGQTTSNNIFTNLMEHAKHLIKLQHKLNAANKEHCKKFKTQRKRGQCTQLGPEHSFEYYKVKCPLVSVFVLSLLSVLFICSVSFILLLKATHFS